jgi:methionine synthase I (cobalamin-dependent)
MSTRAMSLQPIIEILAVQMGGVCCGSTARHYRRDSCCLQGQQC